MFKKLLDKKGFWSKRGPYSDVVLSTRVRLGRNVQGVPFPHKQDEKDANKIKSIAETFVQKSKYNNCATLYDLKEIDSNDKRFLRERNILTYEMEV